MPIYEWQCRECGLRFEATCSIARREEPRPCLSCGAPAEQAVPSEVSGHFNHEVTGPGPQNTGIHGLDTDYDKVIGQHAKQGWTVVEERVREKRRVMAEEGVEDGEQLSRNLDGSYRVLTPEERGVHDRGLNVHRAAMNWRQQERRSRARR